MSLKSEMQELAVAAGHNVYVGCYPHRDDWFANCDGEEWQGPTPEAALASVRSKLIEKAIAEAAKATAANAKVERLKAL